MILRTKDRESLLQIFSTSEQPMEILAYGSRVNGNAHEGSDLDLVIKTNDGQPLLGSQIAEFREKIQESRIPILVELRDWTTLPESFHRQIEQRNEVLFDNRNQTGNK